MADHKRLVLPILLLACLAFLASLLGLLRPESFFSGDGGLKYLMVKQFSRGTISPILAFPSGPGAASLWSEGFYPLGPPFVYEISGQRWISFPVYFPLISSIFHSFLGWRGLYVVPALAVLFCWLAMTRACCARSMAPGTTALALAALALCSPLTLYGAMFWEHTLGACLAALPLLLAPRGTDAVPRTGIALVIGLLAGAAAFFRPEVLILLPCFLGARLVLLRSNGWKESLAMVFGAALSVAAFFACNVAVYGSPLGVHALQVVNDPSEAPYAERLAEMLRALRFTWPVGLFLLGAVPFAYLRLPERRQELAIFAATIVLSIPLIALIVPNDGGKQWGPRYLLVLLPWGAMLVGFAAESLRQIRAAWARTAATLCLAALMVLGALANVGYGTILLAADYGTRVDPVLRLLRAQPESNIIVSHQWITQELTPLAEAKTLLWVRTPEDTLRLGERLKTLGIEEALYVCYRRKTEILPAADGVSEVGRPGDYVIQRVRTDALVNLPRQP